MYVGYTIIFYLGSIILEAYCVGKVHNMLPLQYKDNWSILCM